MGSEAGGILGGWHSQMPCRTPPLGLESHPAREEGCCQGGQGKSGAGEVRGCCPGLEAAVCTARQHEAARSPELGCLGMCPALEGTAG